MVCVQQQGWIYINSEKKGVSALLQERGYVFPVRAEVRSAIVARQLAASIRPVIAVDRPARPASSARTARTRCATSAWSVRRLVPRARLARPMAGRPDGGPLLSPSQVVALDT